MLVLTRKIDEQILIGDDIKITLIRVRGNTVRIGIDAPREVRIARGELKPLEIELDGDVEFELSDRQQAFAHPSPNPKRRPKQTGAKTVGKNRIATKRIAPSDETTPAEPKIYVGTVKESGASPKLSRAPLASFVATS